MFLLIPVLYLTITLLSWILFLRNELAIEAFSQFYPQIASFLTSTRSSLLHLGLNSVSSILFAALGAGIFSLYFRAWRRPPPLKTIVVLAATFLIITFFSYPILSTDVFDYILSDRVAVTYHQNVWLIPPSAVIQKSDSFYQLASWQTLVNPYGVVNQFFYSLAGFASGNDLLTSLFAHKMLTLSFGLGSLFLAYKILKEHFPANLSRGLVLIFWNPLFVLETVGSSHNDILMIFFLLLTINFWLRKNFFLTGLFLAISMQVKFIPVILFPFLFLNLRHLGRQVIFYFLAGFLLVNLLSLAYLGPAMIPFIERITFSSSIYWQSLPQLVHQVFPEEKILFASFFGLILLFQLFLVAKRKKDPWLAFGTAIFLYLLFATSVYWNWYILWIFPVLILLDQKALIKGVIILSFTSLLAYPLYWLSLRYNHQNSLWQVIIYLFLILPPLGVYLHEKFDHKT